VEGGIWPTQKFWETTISATDDIGHDHIGHKACHVFVRLVNQGGQCAAASQGSRVADGIPRNCSYRLLVFLLCKSNNCR